ncbi:hypothetical protein [Desulfoluna butyratoxydans]|uniref:hypothetical protein n=1 Tax=Desulfoluna butyratoxydans TaxID=231438 RepID=UPI0015D10B5C|nr:hypothetical protein [Desulfoluna butyratoxydans]
MFKLNEDEYKSTFSEPMKRVGQDEKPLFDFWLYFDSIPIEDFDGFDCAEGCVSYVWRDSTRAFDHVLINSDVKNVFMVLVLDINHKKVVGHRLLNLNKEYAIGT